MEHSYEFQTLSEFLREPFGRSDDMSKIQKFMTGYREDKYKIKLNAHTKIGGAYYFHVKIPSKSQKEKNMMYDVVIKFFTNKEKCEKATHIRDYYIQFFSNSPSFIYSYAVLYKKHGFLIDNLYSKLDPRYFDKLPEKTNKDLDLSYDKSIYYACQYLSEHRFKALNKLGIAMGKSLTPEAFFKEIKDFQTVKLEQELFNLEKRELKKLDKELDAQDKMKTGDKKRELDNHRKNPTLSTATHKRKIIIDKRPVTKSTSSVKRVTKKTAKKSTRKS